MEVSRFNSIKSTLREIGMHRAQERQAQSEGLQTKQGSIVLSLHDNGCDCRHDLTRGSKSHFN